MIALVGREQVANVVDLAGVVLGHDTLEGLHLLRVVAAPRGERPLHEVSERDVLLPRPILRCAWLRHRAEQAQGGPCKRPASQNAQVGDTRGV